MDNFPDKDYETLQFIPDKQKSRDDQLVTPCLSILWHPDPSRIGSTVPILFGGAVDAYVSRTTPVFTHADIAEDLPLLDRHISRAPTLINRCGAREYEITPPASRMQVFVNGRLISAPEKFTLDELGEDLILSFSNHVILSLFEGPVRPAALPQEYGLIGASAQIHRSWGLVEKIASSDMPVLIRGETGTGKELIAQALHRLSHRTSHKMVEVNMAAIAPDLAAAELFGVMKGAYTGAQRDRPGLFEQALNSTIFLDEIGNAPESLQPMLLRLLETHQFRRVGDTKNRITNARILAATDQPLSAETFNQPLLRRLESIIIEMPPLRQRRADLGLLINYFLSQHHAQQLPGAWSHFTGEMISRMALYHWPGNVRELKNAVQQILLGHPPTFDTEHQEKTPDTLPPQAQAVGRQTFRQTYRHPSEITEEEMLAALTQTGWQIKETAVLLNISRTSLYSMMEKSPRVRNCDDIPDDQIRATLKEFPGDFNQWVNSLRVSRNALKRRLASMGLNGGLP